LNLAAAVVVVEEVVEAPLVVRIVQLLRPLDIALW
jgi:hypothetical protein